MKLLILHLSDIHFKSDSDSNLVLRKLDKIVAVLKAESVGIDACFIAVTGDIAQSGKSAEYAIAYDFLTQLKASVQSMKGLAPLQYIFVSGNHDCDFDRHTAARQVLISTIPSGLNSVGGNDTSIVDICTEVQGEFFQFLTRMDAHSDGQRGNSRLRYRRESVNIEKCVKFECYNTAWLSQLDERQGQLFYPGGVLQSDEGKSDLVVSLFHHPYNWLEASNARDFRSHIERSSDIVLTGHEHESDVYEKRSMRGEVWHYTEGAILQDWESTRSGFNLLTVDIDTARWKVAQYEWVDKDAIYASRSDSGWQSFERNKRKSLDEFQNRKDFTNLLSDPGATFTHPRVKPLRLRDLFVYPDVTIRSLQGEANQIIPGERLLEHVLKAKKLIILGADRAGKTTLAKALYTDLLERGIVPVLLNGEVVRSHRDEDLARIVYSHFGEQYIEGLLEKYKQLDRSLRTILIDDFDCSRLNTRGRKQLLEAAIQMFGRVILFAGEVFELGEIAYRDSETSLLLEYEHCSIRELGHVRRSEVIEKWCALGQEYTADEAEQAFRVSKVEHTIDTLLGRKLLPSFPIFILTILQQIEAGTSLRHFSGSYGYIYEALITGTLAGSSRAAAIDVKYTYLSHIAFQMFTGKRKGLSTEDLEVISEEYFRRFKIRVNTSDMIRDLEESSIFLKTGGEYGFKYSYLYYYFVAKYMQERISAPDEESSLVGVISRLTESVYNEDSANILMFFIYLTKHRQVIGQILANAKLIFAELEPFDLDGHVRFVSEARVDDPKFAYIHKERRTVRREYLQTWDEVEAWTDNEEREGDDVSPELQREYDDLMKLNVALKTIQIMGQILRKFPGSLEGQLKAEIGLESYSLGLRALRALFDVLQRRWDGFRSMVRKSLQEGLSITDEPKLAKTTDHICFVMALALAHGMIKVISYSVGSEHLRETYKEILEGGRSFAFSLIDMSIKLDHLRPFPESEIFRLDERLKSKNFAAWLLKGMVMDHMYLFPYTYDKIQRVCDRLGIAIKQPKLLEGKLKK